MYWMTLDFWVFLWSCIHTRSRRRFPPCATSSICFTGVSLTWPPYLIEAVDFPLSEPVCPSNVCSRVLYAHVHLDFASYIWLLGLCLVPSGLRCVYLTVYLLVLTSICLCTMSSGVFSYLTNTPNGQIGACIWVHPPHGAFPPPPRFTSLYTLL